MTKQIEALKLALEALETLMLERGSIYDKAIETIREALALVNEVDQEQPRLLSAAPCDQCGYNGPGYYQPKTHPCASKHHKALAQERSSDEQPVHQQEPLINRVANKLFGNIEVSVPAILPPHPPTESVSVDGVAYTVPAQVAAEMLRLHLEIKLARQEFVCSTGLCHYKAQQQEPVGRAYLCDKCQTPFDGDYWCPNCGHDTATKELVYTSPPASKPLTDEQIRNIWSNGDCFEEIAFARAIESAHGITKE